MQPSLRNLILEHNDALSTLPELNDTIEELLDLIIGRLQIGGTLYWVGNGGSAADAQHYAAELMVRYSRNRPPIKSIALTTDSSLLTAHSNDYEYETVFSRQVEALLEKNDILCGISTSGNSANVFKAIEVAKSKGALTFGLLGKDGGMIKPILDYPLLVRSNITARIQEVHLMIGHYICDRVEFHFSKSTF